jgi:hypothetical protein
MRTALRGPLPYVLGGSHGVERTPEHSLPLVGNQPPVGGCLYRGVVSKRRSKPRSKPRPGPDDNLAVEQFPELNRQFYSAKLQPHDYLMHRYRSVFLAAQSPEVLACAFDSELSIGDLRATWSTADKWDEEEIRDYVSTESTVLLHHASEALFRLYFAHADSPECPWLAVARLRLPSQFKDRLSRFMGESESDATAQSAMQVFYGHGTVTEDKQAQWTTLKDGLVLLLKHLGRRLLDEAPLYNSAKHGLSLVPGAAGMQFGDQSGPLRIRADGPSITHLTVMDGQRGRRWAQQTVWLNPTQTLGLVLLALYELSNLWHVARCRYAGQVWDQSKVRYVTPELLSEVLDPKLNGEEVRITVPSMSMELLYYQTAPPRAEPTR